MTVTAMQPQARAASGKSDGDRLRLTAGQLIGRAHKLIQRYGHGRGDEGFGDTIGGFTLVGAIYAGAGFYEGRFELRDPVRCLAHEVKVGVRPACQPGCEDPLWKECNLAFTYLALAFQAGPDELLRLDGVTAAARDFRLAVEVGDVLDTVAAKLLLLRVLRTLHPELAEVRLNAPARRTSARPNAKLTVRQVLEIRQRHAGGEQIPALAKAFDISEPTVQAVVTGTSWRHVGGPTRTPAPQGRLDSETVLALRRRRAAGESTASLAREYSLSEPTVHRAVCGRIWREVGGPLHQPRSADAADPLPAA